MAIRNAHVGQHNADTPGPSGGEMGWLASTCWSSWDMLNWVKGWHHVAAMGMSPWQQLARVAEGNSDATATTSHICAGIAGRKMAHSCGNVDKANRNVLMLNHCRPVPSISALRASLPACNVKTTFARHKLTQRQPFAVCKCWHTDVQPTRYQPRSRTKTCPQTSSTYMRT